MNSSVLSKDTPACCLRVQGKHRQCLSWQWNVRYEFVVKCTALLIQNRLRFQNKVPMDTRVQLFWKSSLLKTGWLASGAVRWESFGMIQGCIAFLSSSMLCKERELNPTRPANPPEGPHTLGAWGMQGPASEGSTPTSLAVGQSCSGCR